ncbi:MAG: hypothetical protein LC105_10415 [Chitinophagales bacterium]|nr:hypothetical protein [Chitinophagales bacterium]MCZ2394261.1 hypothetical protein [Chitinophagales bacterium]
MENISKDIIVRGRYNTWDTKNWLLILIFMLLTAIGIFLLSSIDLQKYSYYPLGAALLVLIYIIISVMMLGSFSLSNTSLIWKTINSSIHTIHLDQVGDMQLVYSKSGTPSWLLLNKQGKKIKRFSHISPIQASGAAILFFRYKDILPEIVLNIWNPNTKGKRTYEDVEYKLKIDGTLAIHTKGAIVLFENKLLFLPSSPLQTLSSPEIARIQKARFQTELAKYLPDYHIKTHSIIEAILESNLPSAIRDSYIQKTVNENGGFIFVDITRTGKQWQTYSEGVEIIIVRP